MISFINAFLRYYISLEKTLPLIQTTKLHNGKWPKERISPALFFWGNIRTVIWIVYSPSTRLNWKKKQLPCHEIIIQYIVTENKTKCFARCFRKMQHELPCQRCLLKEKLHVTLCNTSFLEKNLTARRMWTRVGTDSVSTSTSVYKRKIRRVDF